VEEVDVRTLLHTVFVVVALRQLVQLGCHPPRLQAKVLQDYGDAAEDWDAIDWRQGADASVVSLKLLLTRRRAVDEKSMS
jgi:hypothetical protein